MSNEIDETELDWSPPPQMMACSKCGIESEVPYYVTKLICSKCCNPLTAYREELLKEIERLWLANNDYGDVQHGYEKALEDIKAWAEKGE